MMHAFSRRASAAAAGTIALLAVALPASAQRPVPPPTRVMTIDSASVPRRELIIPPPAPVRAVRAAQRAPVEVEPLRPLPRTPAPVQVARVETPDSVASLPPALERRVPPSPQAAMSAVSELRSVVVNSAPPSGATGRCKDGTYLTGSASESSCADRGGLAVLFPPPRATPQVRP